MAPISNLSMEGNKMSTEEVENMPHAVGPSWETVGKFQTFTEADAKRTELKEDETLEVKVRYLGGSTSPFFAVKTRTDPNIAKREEKKKRKARLNKKRRKK